MYKQVPTSLNFVDREKAVEKFWEDNNIFKKSMEHRKEGETYTFYDGPPTANGKPHIGHVETRTIKDMIPRYRTMKGYMVPRKAGWDTHGLPVELKLRSCWVWMVRSRSRNTVWHLSSTNVKRAFGNTRECGKISPVLLVSGLTWITLMLPTMTTSSSPNGGH